MQETPITHPGIPQEVYHTLGKKTFWIFFLDRTQAAALSLLAAIALFVLQAQPFMKNVEGKDLSPLALFLAFTLLAFFAVALLVTLFIVWLIYSNYKYCLGNDSFKIKQGVFMKTEVAIPYRQVQDVDIEQDLSFQMMGLSRIAILTAGHEDEKREDSEDEGVLPAIDSDLAEWLQAELLKRANIEKVTPAAAE